MAEYPYKTVPGKIQSLLNKLLEIGVPPAANQAWMKSIGFTSSNDRSLLKLLRFIGIVDSSCVPTDNWRKYRSESERGKALAQALQKGYSSLFEVYPNANERTEQELADFFSTRTDAGKQVVSKTVTTFKNLCGLADCGNTIAEADSEENAPPNSQVQRAESEPSAMPSRTATIVTPEFGGGVTINLNIQLTLPAEMDREGYGEFFAALRKHLIEPYSENEE